MESDYFANGVIRNTAQAIFTPIFQDQFDRRRQTFTALFNCTSLAVCTWNLRRPAYEPVAIFLNHRRKFVVHS